MHRLSYYSESENECNNYSTKPNRKTKKQAKGSKGEDSSVTSNYEKLRLSTDENFNDKIRHQRDHTVTPSTTSSSSSSASLSFRSTQTCNQGLGMLGSDDRQHKRTHSTVSHGSSRSGEAGNTAAAMVTERAHVLMAEPEFSRSRMASISSSENVIDSMEKEQEGIVMKLMKEITTLQEENKMLRQKLNVAQSSMSSSVPFLKTSPSPYSSPSSNNTSPRSSFSSNYSYNYNYNFNNTSNNSASNNNGNSNNMIPKRRSTITDASIRRVPPSLTATRSRSGSLTHNNNPSLGFLVPPFGSMSIAGSHSHSSKNINYLLSSNVIDDD